MSRHDLMKRIESRRLRAWKTLDACTVLNARDAAMSSQECEEAIRAAAREGSLGSDRSDNDGPRLG